MRCSLCPHVHPLKLIWKVHGNNLSGFVKSGFSLTLSTNNFGPPLILSVCVGLLNFVYKNTNLNIKKCWKRFYPQQPMSLNYFRLTKLSSFNHSLKIVKDFFLFPSYRYIHKGHSELYIYCKMRELSCMDYEKRVLIWKRTYQ